MCVGGEQSHLAFRIATIGAVGVGLAELPDGKAIRSFLGRWRRVCSLVYSSGLEDRTRFEKRFDPIRTEFAANA
jgi:hypothetical protein